MKTVLAFVTGVLFFAPPLEAAPQAAEPFAIDFRSADIKLPEIDLQKIVQVEAKKSLDRQRAEIWATIEHYNSCTRPDRKVRRVRQLDGRPIYEVFGYNIRDRSCTTEYDPVQERLLIDAIETNRGELPEEVEVNNTRFYID